MAIENEEKIVIRASPGDVWKHITEFEHNWFASNPEDHLSAEVLSEDKTMRNGLKFLLREKVAGTYGELRGEFVDVVENEALHWRGEAVYHYLGLEIRVAQSGTLALRPVANGTELAHRLFGEFPASLLGRIFEWYFRNVLRGERAVSKSNRRELVHFKRVLET